MRAVPSVFVLIAALGGVAAAQTVVVPGPAPTVTVTPPAVQGTVVSPVVVPQGVVVSKVAVPQGTINTAVEQPASWAPAPAGSVIETTADRRTVQLVNNYDVVYEVNGVRKPTHGLFLGYDEAGWSGRQSVEQLWPLQVGKRVSYSVDTERGTRNDVMRVLRTEVINVPAGAFYTYVVEKRERPPLTSAERVTTMWYAPSVGAIVKQEESTGELSRKPTVRYEMARMQMPAVLPGSVVIASSGRPDTPEMRALFCNERGTTVRYTDGRTAVLDCQAFVSIVRPTYDQWLASR
jgi:hypothetical protein